MIDLYSRQADRCRDAARGGRARPARIITVEDHWPEGGIGDAVLDALAEEQPHPIVVKLAVRIMPGSGTPAELLAAAGIDADHIAARRASSSGAPGHGDEARRKSAPAGANRWERATT